MLPNTRKERRQLLPRVRVAPPTLPLTRTFLYSDLPILRVFIIFMRTVWDVWQSFRPWTPSPAALCFFPCTRHDLPYPDVISLQDWVIPAPMQLANPAPPPPTLATLTHQRHFEAKRLPYQKNCCDNDIVVDGTHHHKNQDLLWQQESPRWEIESASTSSRPHTLSNQDQKWKTRGATHSTENLEYHKSIRVNKSYCFLPRQRTKKTLKWMLMRLWWIKIAEIPNEQSTIILYGIFIQLVHSRSSWILHIKKKKVDVIFATIA